MALFDFFRAIWLSYLNDLSLAEQVLAALPFAAYLISVPFAVRRHYRGANKNLAIELAEEKQAAQKWLGKYNEANAEIEALARRLPENWQKLVEAERRDGNEARAIGLLRDEFRSVEKPLAQAASQLAEHHASVAFDLGEYHLAEARRYCRLALLHGGENAEISALLDEIETMLPEAEWAQDADYSSWDDIHGALPGGVDSAAAVGALNSATDRQIGLGHYHLAAMLNRRALRIASRSLGVADLFVLQARYMKAQVLVGLGRHQEALEDIDAFAPLLAKALAPEHPNVLATRHLKAQVLVCLGRHQEALEDIDAFAPLVDKALAPDHPHVLAMRHQKAQVLVCLGRHQEALGEIEAFAPLQVKALTPENPNVLATRYLKAQVLNDLGRHQEALDEIDAFAPLVDKALAPEHPHVLLTRQRKAQVLSRLGRHQEALDEINALMPLEVKVLAPDHPDVLAAGRLRVQAMEALAAGKQP